jgi:hypothetical protein
MQYDGLMLRYHGEIDNRLARKICQQLAIAAIR